MPLDVATHRALALEAPIPASANGRSNEDILASLNHQGDAPYHPCPEAYPDGSVPQGEVTRYADWDQSSVFNDTLREIYVYQPAGVNTDNPMNLMVFQDGAGYLHRSGPVRAAAVLDSLHHSGEIEATTAVFINPGRPKSAAADDAETLSGNWPLANKTIAESLNYAGYDYTFEFGSGGHSLRHGGALFADSLRWLWRSTSGESI